MNRWQRMNHSLRGRTFRSIIIYSLIISIAAVGFGYYIYYSSVRRDYRNRAWNMASTAASFIDQEEALEEAEQVIRIYDAMSEEEKVQLEDKDSSLLSSFAEVQDEGFERLGEILRTVQEDNGGKAAFTAFLDLKTGRRVFIADSDPSEGFCPPGSWDQYTKKMIRGLTDGEEYVLDYLFGVEKITATTFKMDPYGYRCMAGYQIGTVKDYPVYIIYDIDMNTVSQALKQVFRFYVLIIAVIVAIVLLFSIWRIDETTVQPINQLTDAALAYVQDRSDEHRSDQHFNNLEIHTGDEIEKLSLAMKEMENDLGSYIQNLTSVTAEKERIGTELSLATRIQADMLPNIYPAFPERPEFDVFASMDPAREVGGDFYDFFLIDEGHLCLVMADVSGKGVPAALFMMASKIIFANNAMAGKSPAQILADTNTAFCSNNREEMFITVWLGILDISTGKLTAANAGHEYPALKRPNGSFELVKDKHGFVIGAMEGMKYTEYELKLEPGAKLFLYTDGVPEATNGEGTMFGTQQMLNALNECRDGSPQEILKNVRQSVDSFVNQAEQFDDLTMLCLEYRGPETPVKEIVVPATIDQLAAINEFIDAELEAVGCSMKAQMQIELSTEEIFGNIVNYAYPGRAGEATVRFEMEEPRTAVLTFIDSGIAYNPLEAPEPDTSLSADDRLIGGLGIFLVRKTMDEVTYRHVDGNNILRIKKRL